MRVYAAVYHCITTGGADLMVAGRVAHISATAAEACTLQTGTSSCGAGIGDSSPASTGSREQR